MLDQLLWRFFLLQILLKNLYVVVLEEESSLVLSFSKTFLFDLKMSSELLKCFAFAWFCIFCLSSILRKVLEHFPPSSSFLILAQIFSLFDWLCSYWCNWSLKFPVNGLNSVKFLSLYLDPFSCKDGASFF